MKLFNYFSKVFSLLFTLLAPLYFGIVGKTTEMIIAAGAGSIALAISNLDRLTEFRIEFLSLKAEMKKAVDEAYAKLAVVQNLTKEMALISLYTILPIGFLNAGNMIDKYALKRRIDKLCEESGIHDPELEKVSNSFYFIHGRKYLHKIVQEAKLYGEINQAFYRDVFDFNDKTERHLPSIEKIRSFLQSNDVEISPQVEETIDNYQYFLIHKEPKEKYTDD